MRSRDVATPRTRLHVYEWGEPDAPAILYWDGRGGTGLHANELGPALVDGFGFRVVAPDAPGHGRSPTLPAEAFRPSAVARLADELLTALELERVTFVGFSWGARIACAFGAQHPARAHALVLVEGGYVEFADLPDHDAGADLAQRIAAAPRRTYPSLDAYLDEERRAIGRWSDAVAAAHAATVHEVDGLVSAIADAGVLGALHHGTCVEPTTSTHDRLRRAGTPILLVTPAGSEDATDATGRAGIERFRRNVPQLETQTLPYDVHDLVSRAPEELARTIGRWLAS